MEEYRKREGTFIGRLILITDSILLVCSQLAKTDDASFGFLIAGFSVAALHLLKYINYQVLSSRDPKDKTNSKDLLPSVFFLKAC
jgi:hypothetical protein